MTAASNRKRLFVLERRSAKILGIFLVRSPAKEYRSNEDKENFDCELIVTIAVLFLVIPAGAGKDNPNSLNAKFMNWFYNEHVVHILVYENASTIYLEAGKPSLYGFEWGGASVEELQAEIDDPGHDFTLTISGDVTVDEFSIKDYYQDLFIAVPGTGPAWSWDHDGDGLGDGNGVGDWNGPILFVRYPHAGFSSGTYYLTFTYYDDGYTFIMEDTITVIVP